MMSVLLKYDYNGERKFVKMIYIEATKVQNENG